MSASVPMRLVAEFFGTFLFMVSILASGGNFLIIGATLAVIVFLIGPVSGASINPAVSLGLWSSGKLSTQLLVLYSLAELFAGAAAVYAYNIVA